MRPALLVLLLALGVPTALAGSGTSSSAVSATASQSAKKKRPSAKSKRAAARKKRAAAKRRASARRRACARRGGRIAYRRVGKSRRRVAYCKLRRGPAAPAPAAPPRVEGGIDDAVVVAVLDGGINPYHWDFLASKMPQHVDGERGNDLPLDRPATEWLDGVAQSGMASFERLDLTLNPNDPEDVPAGDRDPAWKQVEPSTPGSLNAYWLPGTKVIGAATFADDAGLWAGVDAHGVGTTSSVVGNLHGTCPECLLFFINLGSTTEQIEAAIEWVESQPWIDAISNSYGFGEVVPKIYSSTNIEKQRAASERGQTNFFSAGNGFENAYVVPNPTTYSSQKGPDWIVTVGAVRPREDNYYDDFGSDGGSYSGAGKPADVAGVGDHYPNAYTAETVGGTGSDGFGGTSNAAPTVAGLYSRALYRARAALPGPSRLQREGVIATGGAVACGAARSGCELGDGVLTAAELRTRLLHGAIHTEAGTTVDPGSAGASPSAPPLGEEEFLQEGHGTYFARQSGPRSEAWLTEFDRIVGPMLGTAPVLERPAGEHEWMVVDSYCRQENWGQWRGGYYVEGQTELPAADPAWPLRTAYMETCPGGPTPSP